MQADDLPRRPAPDLCGVYICERGSLCHPALRAQRGEPHPIPSAQGDHPGG